MANQYSITVSNGANAVLQRCKESGKKISQVISAAIETLGFDALMSITVRQRMIEDYLADQMGEADEE